VTLPGTQIYHDASTGIWYCYAQGSWHYSIDTCQTWVDVNMLDIRVVEGTGTVDTFGAQLWSHNTAAALQFFDTRYAQSGWHGMTEFVVEYYDGVGYDGEPLKVVDVAITTEQSDSTVWLNNLTPTGAKPESPSPSATITEWDTYVYGQWDNKLLASWIMPNPSSDYQTSALLTEASQVSATATASSTPSSPLTVLFQGTLSPNITVDWELEQVNKCVVPNALYLKHPTQDYSLERLVKDAQCICEVTGKKIGTLAIVEHCSVNMMVIGKDHISSYNFYEKGYDLLFRGLSEVLALGAQLQHFGCNLAGPNPYDPTANWQNVQSNVILSPEYQAMKARTMLSAIADLTQATVFASSDFSGMTSWEVDDVGTVVSAIPFDMALEFVVGPAGYQIPWADTNPGGSHEMNRVWEKTATVWTPDPRTADTGGPFQLSPSWPATNICTWGENQVEFWAPLPEVRWWRR
jgi:hypothetical protein